MFRPLLALAIPSLLFAGSPGRYNVVWNSPSENSLGSMPIGNGDIGLNAWVEPGGDLVFYISKTDAWNENARLLKIGRVRVRLSPPLVAAGVPFRQELRLPQGDILINGSAEVRLWVDANRPLVRVEVNSAQPVSVEAKVEQWRTARRTLEGREVFSAYGMDGGPEPIVEEPDAPARAEGGRIVWFHRNSSSIWPFTLRHQGMEAFARSARDPLLNRTFGGMLFSPGMKPAGPDSLHSNAPAKSQTLLVAAATAMDPGGVEWKAAIGRAAASASDAASARRAHEAWWRQFWKRSWIEVSGDDGAEAVSRGYALQRFLLAAAGRGGAPIKFNGSIFTVEPRRTGLDYDADYRSWGGPYWFQNTRLPYWAMLAAGDFDLTQPLYRMYLDALPLAKARTRVYFGHKGASFPETMYFWGSYANSNYGWKREGRHPSFVENTYIRYYWSGALELLSIALDQFSTARDERFARETLLPLAAPVLEFYAAHYKRDAAGKLLIQPAMSLETWPEVVNPTPEIAGLQWVLDGLLALPASVLPAPKAAAWRKLRGELPPLPVSADGGPKRIVAAREILSKIQNVENPELYAVFPYRLFGLQKPELDVARETYARRRFQRSGGWQQDPIQAALLGLTADARNFVTQNFTTSDKLSRFPAFWGPNFDWVPDQDHGSAAMIALQRMVLQDAGGRLLVLPAWPKQWDVSFRLHAPGGAVVEGYAERGTVKRLETAPAQAKTRVTVF